MWTFRKITNSHENKTEWLHPGPKSEASGKKKSNNVHQQKRSPITISEICHVYKGMYINPTLSTTYFKRECSDLQEIPGAKLQRFKLDCTVLADTATALESLEPGWTQKIDSFHPLEMADFLNVHYRKHQEANRIPFEGCGYMILETFMGFSNFHVEFQWSVPLQIYRERSGKDYDGCRRSCTLLLRWFM